jgi:spermidine/putrescine transport system ATP-binding protein
VWVGVRPEKVFLSHAGSETDDGSNALRDATVTDVSFVGVSTQYLARLASGQELMVFEQNTGARESFRPGDRVDLHWMPNHTFLLDASQDATAGAQTMDLDG